MQPAGIPHQHEAHDGYHHQVDEVAGNVQNAETDAPCERHRVLLTAADLAAHGLDDSRPQRFHPLRQRNAIGDVRIPEHRRKLFAERCRFVCDTRADRSARCRQDPHDSQKHNDHCDVARKARHAPLQHAHAGLYQVREEDREDQDEQGVAGEIKRPDQGRE